jgi:hypothetical protein
MWSKVYIIRTPDNKEVAVALMDTQVDSTFFMWKMYHQIEVANLDPP